MATSAPVASERAAAPSRSKAQELRAEFPLLSECVYLNSNSTGAIPWAAKGALDEYWRTLEGWRDGVWERWWPELARYADEVAAFIGAPAGSVVCDTNLATLLGRVLSCFDFRERPRVVTTDLEFPSIPFMLRGFARYGAEPVVVPSLDGVSLDGDQIARAIDERTQLVCISHATFATGSLVDVAPIVRRAREVGALVALDVYQSVGAVPLDVATLDVDIVLGGSHKWLCGSYENAFLYVRPSLASRLEPAATGWIASADPLSFAPPTRFAENARRFASGTPAVLPALFSRPGLGILRELGIDTIRALSLVHTDRVIALADEARLGVASPRAHHRRGGIVALRFAGDAEVARQLVFEGFVCSYRGGIRIAPHFYNTDGEIDSFMAELARLARAAS
jgi:kynureninase